MFDDELGPVGRPQAMHHPFTMPNAEDTEAGLIESDPTTVRSVAYDLECNGWELASGSVRNHRSEVQKRVFDGLGIAAAEAQEKFGFLHDAFRFGAPPHAGLDRKSVVLGQSVAVRVDLGGCRIIKQKNQY